MRSATLKMERKSWLMTIEVTSRSLRELGDHPINELGADGIDPCRWLVEDDELWLQGQRRAMATFFRIPSPKSAG